MKLDKSQYTKEQYKKLKAEAKLRKTMKLTEPLEMPTGDREKFDTAFVLGNGTSRNGIDPQELSKYGIVYGCNALYRSFAPDYLVAVDTKMILEIAKTGYHRNHTVWTNPNKAYARLEGLNYFQPSKGWSSGPTALWLASQHGYKNIYVLGFDFKGLDDGKKFNNIYADSYNYKKSTDGATFFGNWMRQTKSVIKDHKEISYFRIIAPDNYVPEELNTFDNLKHMPKEMFQNIYNLGMTS